MFFTPGTQRIARLNEGVNVTEDVGRSPEHVVDVKPDRDHPQASVANAARLEHQVSEKGSDKHARRGKKHRWASALAGPQEQAGEAKRYHIMQVAVKQLRTNAEQGGAQSTTRATATNATRKRNTSLTVYLDPSELGWGKVAGGEVQVSGHHPAKNCISQKLQALIVCEIKAKGAGKRRGIFGKCRVNITGKDT